MNTVEIPKKENRQEYYIPQEERHDGYEMTLDDAISHLDDLLNPERKRNDCIECRQEHERLRGWLIELRGYKN